MGEVLSRVVVGQVDGRGVGRKSGNTDRLGLVIIKGDLLEAPSRSSRGNRRRHVV